jgi:hypothetical protein
VDLVHGRPVGTGHRERMASIDDFATEHGANDITSVINQGAPELMATAPLGAAAGASRFPLLTDMAVNAGWEGSKAMANGDAGRAALAGAGGALAGRAAGRLISGGRPNLSDSARQLVERGVMPTPGQLFDGPVGRAVKATEDRLTSIPVVGDIITHARKRSLGDYGKVTINDALAPLPKEFGRVSGGGVEAVEEASRKVSAAFERGLDGMEVQPQMVLAAYDSARQMIPRIGMLDEGQAAKVIGVLDDRISALLANGSGGQAAKQFDAELGHYARKYSRSPNPGDHPIGQAFDTMQEAWRQAMGDATSGGNNKLVLAANQAYRSMLPVVKAADKAMAQGGVFTPNQFMRSRAQFRQGQDSFDRAAQDVLPSRVPDSGTAGRLITGGLIGGGAAPVTTLTTAALTGLAYSRGGISVLINGLGGAVPPKARARLLAMAPQDAVKVLQGIAGKNPQFAQSLAAQLGRMGMQAAQQEE